MVPFQGDAIYSRYCIHWHQLINTAVFLRNDHRFSEDKEYGELVERFCSGTVTKEDIDKINTRLLNDGHGNGGKLELPKEDTSDVCYACARNDERNSITTSIFRDLVQATHPMAGVDGCASETPKNAVIIEAAIFDLNNDQCSRSFEMKVYNKCGDSDVRVQTTKKVDASLKFYSGIPLMINNNKHIKEGRGNGTKCIGISVHLKKDCNVDVTNWDGRLVHTVSVLDVEYMVCEKIVENEGNVTKRFKLFPDKDTATLTMKIDRIKHTLNVKIIQFGVNANKATTGHKLQGVSLNRMIVRSWAYGVPNWIYVVLSRVRTLQGLFICEKLKYTESFAVDPKLLQEEERLKKLEDDLIKFLESSSNNNNEDVCDESCNEINKNNDIVKKKCNRLYQFFYCKGISWCNSYLCC